MSGLFTYQIPPFEACKQIEEFAGRKNPEIKRLQFWYNKEKRLVIVLMVLENQSEFSAIQVADLDRSTIDLYSRRDFKEFVYAPMALTPV